MLRIIVYFRSYLKIFVGLTPGSMMQAVVFAFLFAFSAVFLVRFPWIQAGIFTMTDAFVVSYLLYDVVSVLWLRELPPDPLRMYEWGIIVLLYVLVRNLREGGTRIVLFCVVLSGVIQAISGISQLVEMVPSKHVQFGLTGNFLNPGPLGGYLAICIVVASGLLREEWKKRGPACFRANG